MKKSLPTVFIISIIIIIVILLFNAIKTVKTVDWQESFNEKSNKPYGVSVLYKELPKLFKNQKVRTVYHTPEIYLQANSELGSGNHIAEGSFLIIGNSDYLYDESIDELLNFVSDGNTLFISDYYFNEHLYDTLQIETTYRLNAKDSVSELLFSNSKLKDSNTLIDKNKGDYYFSAFDSINYTVLGYTKTKNKTRPNFIQVPFGEGDVYLHLQPKIFTNYNLLKGNHYTYVEAALSYLPDNDVYFDSFTKNYDYYGEAEKKSNLSWFLQQRGFKWAWYILLLLALLFIIFNAKRRQRVIKIIKPIQNTSLAFVKTISNLYFETKDHKNLIQKKITYFLEKVRTDYNLDTSVLDEEFINRLSDKSGKKKDSITTLIDFINWSRNKQEFSEENLILINKHIEAFYAK